MTTHLSGSWQMPLPQEATLQQEASCPPLNPKATSSSYHWHLSPLHTCRSSSCRGNLPHVCVSHSIVSDSLWPWGLWPARLLRPCNSPGKNTGVGCHFLLQGIFPTQESNPCLLCLLHWQVGSLLPEPSGKLPPPI